MAIDLNAIIAEAQRNTVPLTIGQTTYQLPGELPLDVFSPLLDEDLGLEDVLAEVARRVNDSSEETLSSVVVDALIDYPHLPLKLVKAAGASARALLGDDAYAAFWATRPSATVVRGFWKELSATYSVSLLDFFGSGDSSPTTGEPSKPTSNGSTDSTPEPSSETPATPEAA